MRGAEAATAGKPLPLRPRATNYGRLEGYVAFPAGAEVRAWADVDHVASNTVDPAGLVRLPARWLLGLGIGARWVGEGIAGGEGQLDVGAVMRDALDRRARDVIGYALPGRSWTVRIAWHESAWF